MFNVTRHALMRYISRKELSKVINDSTFDNWRKEFPDKAEKYQEMLLSEIDNASFITEMAFSTYKKAKYYINSETLMIFIVNDQNIITCYRSEYGIGFDLDKIILSSLLVGMKQKQEEVSNYILTADESRKNMYEKIQGLKSDIASLELEIKAMRQDIKVCESIIEQTDARQKLLNEQLFNIISKIVKPKNSL